MADAYHGEEVKMMNSVLEMMNSVLKMMNSALTQGAQRQYFSQFSQTQGGTRAFLLAAICDSAACCVLRAACCVLLAPCSLFLVPCCFPKVNLSS